MFQSCIGMLWLLLSVICVVNASLDADMAALADILDGLTAEEQISILELLGLNNVVKTGPDFVDVSSYTGIDVVRQSMPVFAPNCMFDEPFQNYISEEIKGLKAFTRKHDCRPFYCIVHLMNQPTPVSTVASAV